MAPSTVARQAPLSMGILQARILQWVAMPSSRDLPNPGSNPGFPHCRQILYCLSHQGNSSKSNIWAFTELFMLITFFSVHVSHNFMLKTGHFEYYNITTLESDFYSSLGFIIAVIIIVVTCLVIFLN